MRFLPALLVLSLLTLPSAAFAEKSCPPGKAISDDTAGHCCWPGQVWTKGKCVGKPTCPDDMDTDEAAAACVPKKCPPEGDGILPDTRVDGIHCCFKGQAWAKSQNKCVGKPTQCPEDSGYGVIDGREGCYTAGERRLAAHDDERKKSMSQIHHVTAILVHAPPSKPNGKPWDVPGADEPPDLFVAVAQGGRQLGASQVVRNSFDATFKVNMTIDPKNGPLTIRVLDKDLMNDDFVAEVTADFGAGAAGKHLFADGQGYVQIVESAARQE